MILDTSRARDKTRRYHVTRHERRGDWPGGACVLPGIRIRGEKRSRSRAESIVLVTTMSPIRSHQDRECREKLKPIESP
jgi:hypothetical protein